MEIFRFKVKRVTIGAHDELVLQAPKVRIGFLGGETTDINLVGGQRYNLKQDLHVN